MGKVSPHSTLVLLVDASGSMRDRDPQCIRAEAANLLLSVLPDGDRISVGLFGDAIAAQGVGPEVLSAGSRLKLNHGLSGCAAGDASTDVGAALMYAARVVQAMAAADRKAFPPHVVLLTDGHNQPPAGADSDPLAAASLLKDLGVAVHTLGLGAGADGKLLGALATTTGGQAVYTASPEDLVSGFLSVARVLAHRWLLVDQPISGPVSFEVPGWVTQWRAVFIPDSTGAITVGNVKQATLFSSSYSVFESQQVSPILRVNTTATGRFILDGAGSLVFGATLPKRVPESAYFPCRVRALWRRRDSRSVSGVLVETTVTADPSGDVLYDDAQHEDELAGDGVWGGRCRAI